MNHDKILEKIRKLSALSKSSNINEATLALERIQRIITKYNVDINILKEIEEDKEKIIRDTVWTSRWRWNIDLMMIISNHYDCKSMYLSAGKAGTLHSIYGYPLDVETTKIVFSKLADEIKEMAENEYYNDFNYLKQKTSFERDYIHGIIITLDQRLRQIKSNIEDIKGYSTALVVVKAANVEEYTTQNVKYHKVNVPRYIKDEKVYIKGKIDGKYIKINELM